MPAAPPKLNRTLAVALGVIPLLPADTTKLPTVSVPAVELAKTKVPPPSEAPKFPVAAEVPPRVIVAVSLRRATLFVASPLVKVPPPLTLIAVPEEVTAPVAPPTVKLAPSRTSIWDVASVLLAVRVTAPIFVP